MTNDGWTEWSKHVLKELERLNDNHETIRDKIEEIQQSIVEIKGGQQGIEELRSWKKDMDEVISPTQLKELRDQVTELEKFKIKAMTIFLVLQTLVGIALAVLAL
jgi:DNA repair exonuclease SbcCD ATPase subunit